MVDFVFVLFFKDILNQMNKLDVPMNLRTLNSILQVLSTMITKTESKKYALKTIAEAKKFNIEPCLASYCYLLKIFCSDSMFEILKYQFFKFFINYTTYFLGNNKSTILVDILNHLEGKSFTIQDITDTNFFMAAMENCRYHLQNFGVAQRVHSLLLSKNNYNLIGDSYKESIY